MQLLDDLKENRKYVCTLMSCATNALLLPSRSFLEILSFGNHHPVSFNNTYIICGSTVVKIAGSIPAGVSGFFIDRKSFLSHYGPGVDSASNRNKYQEHFLGVKAAGA